MRVAAFNVENLFSRAKALNHENWSDGRGVLERYEQLSSLLNEVIYTAPIKRAIRRLLVELGLEKRDDAGEWAILRQNRGRLVRRSAGSLDVVANGRTDWLGWVELKTETVNARATEHTAMVIRDVGADVLGVVEAENRITLQRFSSRMLEAVGGRPYDHVMVIDGNDERGIDVGLMTRAEYEIESVRSHVDDRDGTGRIFSRDCPEYRIATPGGARVVVLVNHLKSKGYGSTRSSNALRERQARHIAQIYRRLRKEGEGNVVVCGDLNDTPDARPLAPLFRTDLRDISEHPTFVSDGRPGTYANGTKGQKLDYVLLSPAMFARVTGGGVFRKGVWGGTNGTLFPHYPTMTRAVHAASDHAALYADIDM